METNATITLHSIYKGHSLFKLALSYGKLNFISPASGMGKTAIGLFLRDESFRRLGITTSGPVFKPKPYWEIEFEGPLGFVEYVSSEPPREKLIDFLNFRSQVESLFRIKGRAECSRCKSSLIQRESSDLLAQLNSKESRDFLLCLKLSVSPENILSTLEWARSHSITRFLYDQTIQGLPRIEQEDASFAKNFFEGKETNQELVLVRELIQQTTLNTEFSQSLGDVINLSLVASNNLGLGVLPVLLAGKLLGGAERTFEFEKEWDLSTPYLCLNCGLKIHELSESKIDGLTLRQIQQLKLKDLRSFFQNNFSPDWFRIFDLEIGDVFLGQATEEISSNLVCEFKLLSLVLSEARDLVIFVDSKLTHYGKIFAVELSILGNLIVSHLDVGISLEDFLPLEIRRPSRILDKQIVTSQIKKRSSIEPLMIEAGLEKAIVELFASLPVARQRNLTAKELSYHFAKCSECAGVGYTVVTISNLGKQAEVCKTCLGARYKEQALFVKYQDFSVAQVLELSVDEAIKFFSKRSEITGQLSHLSKAGLGSYRLGDEWRTMPLKARLAIDPLNPNSKVTKTGNNL